MEKKSPHDILRRGEMANRSENALKDHHKRNKIDSLLPANKFVDGLATSTMLCSAQPASF
jgi:hypothetical protein